jgi:membrane fusion protein (multidrug efflux system)
VTVPVSALRKGPDGDHVFVVAAGDDGSLRAHLRRVDTGAMAGDAVLVAHGLEAGERVATSGSFKLRDGMRIAVVDQPGSTRK